MNPLTELLCKSLALVLASFACLWLVSLWRCDTSIVDPFWGIGFVVVAWFVFVSKNAADIPLRCWLLAGLTTVWGVRLSAHLTWRNSGHGEDKRYVAMRTKHGRRFWWISLMTVFVLQAVILWVVSMPVQVAMFNGTTRPLSWLDLTGITIWLTGLLFEAVGDFQMARFQADPANASKVMNRGLWRLTRHPNYFGDFCIWWGLYMISAAGGAVWTVFSPLLMSFLLLKVSGVSLLEKTITSRRPEYAAYQRRTNAFFPWWPHR
jgi:steroid 5-alpha reductase family enzyme